MLQFTLSFSRHLISIYKNKNINVNHKAIKRTDVNRTCHSIRRGLLEIVSNALLKNDKFGFIF